MTDIALAISAALAQSLLSTPEQLQEEPMQFSYQFKRSSNLEFANYDPETEKLSLKFQSGGAIYHYTARGEMSAQQAYDALLEQDQKDGRSAGRFFIQSIKPFFNCTKDFPKASGEPVGQPGEWVV